MLSGTVVFTGSFLNTFLDSTFHLSSVEGGNYASLFSGSSFIGMLLLGYLARTPKTTREFGLATAADWLLSWVAIVIAWFVGGGPLGVVLLLMAICGFCQAAGYNFSVNALERGDPVGSHAHPPPHARCGAAGDRRPRAAERPEFPRPRRDDFHRPKERHCRSGH